VTIELSCGDIVLENFPTKVIFVFLAEVSLIVISSYRPINETRLSIKWYLFGTFLRTLR